MTIQRSILLVDDERENRAIVQFFLESAGYAVTTAGDGVEAEYELQRFKPDLIVLNCKMPRMDGEKFLRRLRSGKSESSSVPVIVFSASETALQSAFECGAQAYLITPFLLSRLLATVKEVLEGAA